MSSPGLLDPTCAALLAAMQPDRAALRDLVRGRGPSIDWERLLERAAAHKVVALLASRLLADEGAVLPPEIATRLAEKRAAAVRRNAQARETLGRVAAVLESAAVPFLVVKGSVLAEQVYDAAEQRLFFDLDIVVRREHVDAAARQLAHLGYQLWGADRYVEAAPASGADLLLARAITRRSLLRHAHELPFVTADKSLLPIDLHWHVMPRGRARASDAALWAHATPTHVGGRAILTFDPEATLVHLASHALSNRPWGFRLLHLCDFAWAAHRLPVDAPRLRAVAREWGADADLLRASFLVERGLGIALPPRLQLDTSRFPGRDRLAELADARTLIDGIAAPTPPTGWARRKADLRWGLAVDSLRSTAILLFAKYTAVAEFALRRRFTRFPGSPP